jgi:oligopeptide/dipeptide ABC transporter ATP-binding protein
MAQRAQSHDSKVAPTPMTVAMQSAPAEAAPLVQVAGLRVRFTTRSGVVRRHTTTVRAVDGVTFDVRRGETLGLVGESGCGKSTTGRAILQLIRPNEGSVRLDGQELTTLDPGRLRVIRRRMQLIFQDTSGSLDPRMTVGRLISEPLRAHGLSQRNDGVDRVDQLLNTVGLNPSMAKRYPHEFSGGQRQRIGIARALALDPEFVVADEPISALDVSIQAQIINLLERLQAELGLTFLFIAHDLAVVRHISHRVAVMYLGRVVELAERNELYRHPIHPYTQALLSAVPVPDPTIERQRRRIFLTGDVASPANPIQGCRFSSRCWLRQKLGNPEVCNTVDPPMVDRGGGHVAACHFPEAA